MLSARVLPLAAVFLLACGSVAPTATVDPRPTQTRAAEISERATFTAPTATPMPTNTPAPTATPRATSTPLPTATRATLSASAYITSLNTSLQLINTYTLAIINACAYESTDTCVRVFNEQEPLYQMQARLVRALEPPIPCKQVHYSYLSVLVHTDDLIADLRVATAQRSPSRIRAALNANLSPVTDALNITTAEINKGDCR